MTNKQRSFFPNIRKQSWVTLFLEIAAIEGFLLSIFLFIIPSSPENRIFCNLTLPRLIFLIALLSLALVASGLAIKSQKNQRWAQIWSSRLMGDIHTVPQLSAVLLVLFLLAAGWLILFRAEDFMKLNQAYLVRLMPLLAWVGLLWLQLWLIWWWIWKRNKFILPKWSCDAAACMLIFLTAFWSRVSLTSYGLPYQTVWDEVVTYYPAMKLLITPGLKPNTSVPGYGMAAYGDPVTYIAAAGELAGFYTGLRSGAVKSVQDYISPPAGVKNIFGAVHASGIPLKMPRTIFSLLNSLAPVGIYLALRRGLRIKPWFALAGGLIFAIFSSEVLFYSAYILADALTATVLPFLLITAWKSLEDEQDHLKYLLLAGFLSGVMISITIRVLMVVVIPFLALFLSRDHSRFLLKIFLITASLAAGFVVVSPYTVLDIPLFLAKTSAFTWSHQLSLADRLAGLVYYIQGAIMPGGNSAVTDSLAGSAGLGLAAGIFAILGFGKLLLSHPRHSLLMIAFIALHLFMITSIERRYTRHALVLYPILCIYASAGLSLVSEWLQTKIKRHKEKTNQRFLSRFPERGVPALVLCVFLLFSIPQFRHSFQYIQQTQTHQVPQVQAAAYLSQHLEQGDRVGIMEEIPWVEGDLEARGIPFVRIPSSDTFADLRAKGITVVAGTDQFGGDYASLGYTIWKDGFLAPGRKLAEFGSLPLLYDGYPAGMLYIFIARLN